MSHVPSKNRIVLYIKFHSKRPGVGKRSFSSEIILQGDKMFPGKMFCDFDCDKGFDVVNLRN